MIKNIIATLILSAAFNIYSQKLFINEIMSSNATTLADKDGDYSDWLEIFNADSIAVNLTNYGLSDNNSSPFKWTFPHVIIKPDSFLLVFASGKESQIPAVHYETIIDWGDTWRYFIGTQEPPANWRTLDFDILSWREGSSGFGYGDGDDSTNVAPDYPAKPAPAAVFLHKIFYVEKADQVSNLFLHIDYDDGFVAYLNNREIARANIGSVGTPPPYDQLTNTDHEAQMYQGGSPDLFEVENIQSILQSGWNALAVQVHNATQTSSDMTMIPFLTLGMNYIPQNARGPSPFLTFPGKPELHAAFKISSSGEELILSDPQGQTIDHIEFGAIPADLSFGRQPDGGSRWYYFDQPTPAAINNTTGYQQFTPAVQFSRAGGFYESPFFLELTTAEGNLTIRYTLDGSEPANTADIYGNPISVDSITVVRARVFAAGMLPGKTVTHTYFINQSFELPVVALSTDPANFFDNETGIYVFGDNADRVNYPYFGSNFWEDWERPLHVEFFGKDGAPGFALDAGVKIFGSWSRLYPQKSLSIFARGRYGQDRINYPIFPGKNILQYKTFILRNSGQDWGKTFFRDALMSKLVNKTGLDYMEYRPTLVYLNGQCWGIHNIREKMNEHYLADNRGVDPDNIDLLEWDKTDKVIMIIHGDDVQYLTLIDFIKNNDLSDPANYAYVQTLMDVQNFMDYSIAIMFYANPDWPWNNVKCWRPRTAEGKFKWLLFDNDYGFHCGHLGEGANMFREIGNQQNDTNLLFFKLLENESYRNEFINHNADHLNITFDPARVTGLILEMKNGIKAEMPRHIERWKNTFEGPWWLGKSIDSMDEWYNSIQVAMDFAFGRGDYVRQHLMDEFNLNDGMGTIHLNVFPADGGLIKINSQVVEDYPWHGKYFVQVPVQLTALAKPGFRFSCWEGSDFPNSQTITFNIFDDQTVIAVFVLDSTAAGNVVINEINYKSADNFDTKDWVELHNSDSTAIDLTNWRFIDNDDSHAPFILPANTILEGNGYLVICREKDTFKQFFPTVENCLGDFDFGLSSKGELIRFYNGEGLLVDSLVYDEQPPWPTAPNGNGPTLELKNPQQDNSLAQNWAASLVNGGTPGSANSALTGIEKSAAAWPGSYCLKQNYPNPCNPATTINYHLPAPGKVELTIFNTLGKKIRTLVDAFQSAGEYKLTWDGKNVNSEKAASGIYIYRLRINQSVISKKMVLIR